MFLSNMSVAGPTGDAGHDFWFGPSPMGRSISGAIVNADTALQFSTVYKCVKVLAETVSMLPRHMYRTGDARERVTDHPVIQLLANRPNRWQTPMQFMGMMEAHKELRGNAYAEIHYGRKGQIEELVPLHPDRVTPEIAAGSGLPRWRVRSVDGSGERILVQGEVMHLMGLTVDGYKGINPILAEREAIGGAIAARDYGLRFWNNDARPPFWISIPATMKLKDNDARSNFRDDWQAAYGGANQHRPAVLDNGMELKELGIDNDTAQWMEARKYSDIDLCGLWRMPPHKVGILSDAKYANIEMQAIEFVTDTILPQLVGWEETIKRDLLGDDDSVYVEFLVTQLLRGDTKSRYDAYGTGIQDGWLTRNEVRRMENRAPLPGLDEPLQPLNMARAGAAGLLPNNSQGNGGNQGTGQGGQTPRRAVALLQASAERVARKEVGILRGMGSAGADPAAVEQAFAGHARFVADVMAVSPATADAYTAQVTAQAISLATQTATTGAIDLARWSTTQTAALLQLEE